MPRSKKSSLLEVSKGIAASTLGFSLFPLKSLAVNIVALLYSIATAFLIIPGGAASVYQRIKESTKSRLLAGAIALLVLVGLTILTPVTLTTIAVFWVVGTVIDMLTQPIRGIYIGVKKGLDDVINQLFSFTNAGGGFMGEKYHYFQNDCEDDDNFFGDTPDDNISNFSTYLKFNGVGQTIKTLFDNSWKAISIFFSGPKQESFDDVNSTPYQQPGFTPREGASEEPRATSDVVVPTGKKNSAPVTIPNGTNDSRGDDYALPSSGFTPS